MKQKFSMVQKLAWVYAAGFLGIVIVTHIKAFNDANGLSFGLFKIDPIDDVNHMFTFAAAALAGWSSPVMSILYFRAIGILYGFDVVSGFTIGTAGSVTKDLAINGPHIIISLSALFIGFVLSKKYRRA